MLPYIRRLAASFRRLETARILGSYVGLSELILISWCTAEEVEVSNPTSGGSSAGLSFLRSMFFKWLMMAAPPGSAGECSSFELLL